MSSGLQDFHSNWERQREALSAYADGELDDKSRTQLESHLADCSECRAELASLRRTRALLRALPQPPLPRSFTLPAQTPANVRSISDAPGTARRRVAVRGRLSRLAQQVGSLVAAAGIVLLIGSWATGLLGSQSHVASNTTSYGGATGARATQQSPASATTDTAPAVNGATRGPDLSNNATEAAAAATATATPTSAHNLAAQPSNDSATSVPVAPIAGAGLTAGGLVLIVVGRATQSRRRRS